MQHFIFFVTLRHYIFYCFLWYFTIQLIVYNLFGISLQAISKVYLISAFEAILFWILCDFDPLKMPLFCNRFEQMRLPDTVCSSIAVSKWGCVWKTSLSVIRKWRSAMLICKNKKRSHLLWHTSSRSLCLL